VSHYAFLNDRPWHLAVLAAALAGCMTVPALADIPSASNAMSASAKTNADRLVADAQKAIAGGNSRMALISLKNALTADPRNVNARVLLGTVLAQMGDSGGAERELRQARKDGAPPALVLQFLFDVMLSRGESQLLLTQFPDPGTDANAPGAAEILMARALALNNLKKPAEALDAIDRSLALRRDGRGLLVRARLSYMQGQQADARKFADEAITKSNTPDAMLFKTGLLLARGENDAALDLTNRLLEKYPTNMQGRFARIETYIALKQDDKAKTEVDAILSKISSAFGGAYFTGTYYRALLLARAGDTKSAWSIAQNLPGEFRDSQPRIGMMVAEIAADSGNEDTAAAMLGRLLLKNPELVAARIRLASIRLKQNNVDESLKILDPVKASADVRVQGLLSNTYMRLGRNGDALTTLRKANADGKASPEIKRSIALLEIQTGNPDQGIKDLTQLAAKEPTNPALVAPLVGALVQAKRYSEALTAADRLGTDPKMLGRSLMFRGGVLAAQNNNAGARAAFDKAVALDPKNNAALYARAQFLFSTENFADASRDLRTMLAQDPKNLAALLRLTDIALRQGQDGNVRSLLSQAVAAAPQNPTPRLALIRYLIGRRDFKSALPLANDFVRVQPSNADAVTLLGNVQTGLGQKKEAVTSYRRLVGLMPTAAVPQVLLGTALQDAGDLTGAGRALETAVKLAPTSPDVRAAQVRFLLNQHNNDAALAAARSFQSSSPGTAADLLLADALDTAKQRDQAVVVLNKSLADKPSNVVLLRLATYAVQAKNTGRASDLMSKWLTVHSDDAAVRQEYAGLLMQLDDKARAVVQYEMLLKQNPNNVVVLNNLGWLIQSSDPKRALSLLSQAAKLTPNSADVLDTLGWLKVQQKDAAGGLAHLDKAHKLAPQDGEITYHLVLALDANAKRDQARNMLKTLLASGTQFKDRQAATQLASSWH
jgi:putative PEP-CTERM system TPR-repeat lipoprotein